MKIEIDLIRDILVAVEKSDLQVTPWQKLDIKNRKKEEIILHINVLSEAGFLKLAPKMANYSFNTVDDRDPKIMRLTLTGSNFLDHARSDTLWEKAKEYVKNTTGTVTLNIILTVMQRVAAGLLNLPIDQ